MASSKWLHPCPSIWKEQPKEESCVPTLLQMKDTVSPFKLLFYLWCYSSQFFLPELSNLAMHLNQRKVFFFFFIVISSTLITNCSPLWPENWSVRCCFSESHGDLLHGLVSVVFINTLCFKIIMASPLLAHILCVSIRSNLLHINLQCVCVYERDKENVWSIQGMMY